jgi:hypothetical protein
MRRSSASLVSRTTCTAQRRAYVLADPAFIIASHASATATPILARLPPVLAFWPKEDRRNPDRFEHAAPLQAQAKGVRQSRFGSVGREKREERGSCLG